MKLNPRQQAFVREYLLDLNATRAAQRAGYKGSDKVLEVTGGRLLGHAGVAAQIAAAQAKRAEKLDLKADHVLRNIKRIADVDMRRSLADPRGLRDPAHVLAHAGLVEGQLLPLHLMPDDVALAVSSVEVDNKGNLKVKFWDKVKTNELLARHLRLLDGPGSSEDDPLVVKVIRIAASTAKE